ncbi:MAG: hypothetical protein A2283_05515 [Lentisphaerae bacterium RIFOXYA12_FULL_48_11]|nr:MAG: hypothetical protein A2283_05515 [Lentisphaerae bacterium RIFOXYA12_FULL_48_11]
MNVRPYLLIVVICSLFLIQGRAGPLDPPHGRIGTPGGSSREFTTSGRALPFKGFGKDLNTVDGLQIIGSDTVDFGKYPARERKVANFMVKNSSKTTIKIGRIYKTCVCATAKCDKSELKPGQLASIEIVILPNSIYGNYSKPTYFENTDVNNRFLGVTVKGTAVPLVEIAPCDFVYAGRIETGREWKSSFDLTATEAGVRLGQPEVKCDYPVEITFIPISGQNKCQHKLDIKLCPIATSCDFQCSVIIPVLFPTNQPALSIGIAGKIGIEMIAFPGTFRMVVSTNDIIRSFNLRVLGDTAKVLDPGQLKLPDEKGFSCKVEQAGDGKTIDAVATFTPEFVSEVLEQGKKELYFSIPGIASARVVCLAVQPCL